MTGMRIKIDITELKAEEMFNPIIFAKQEVVKNKTQYEKVIPLIPRIKVPTRTKDIV
jgi:hypothetical protein